MTLKKCVCAAERIGYEILQHILPKDKDIQFVVTTGEDSYERKIYQLCLEHNVRCYREKDLNHEFVAIQREENVDLAFLLWWPKIISQEVIDSVDKGFINTHPSLLPYNRGKHPYFWSIVDGTPYGVTIHCVDAKIDHGKILLQQEIPVEMTDTAESLYQKSTTAMIELFVNNYQRLIDFDCDVITSVQPESPSLHLSPDIESITHIDLDKEYKAADLINILRGRTFTHGASATFEHQGERYYIRTNIEKVSR